MNSHDSRPASWPENMQELYSASVGGAYDAAKYHDIWRRVFPEMTETNAPAAPGPESALMPEAVQAAVAIRKPDYPPGGHGHSHGEPQRRSNCFGRETARFESQLRHWIDDELNDWRYFQALAARAPNRRAATRLNEIARKEHEHARKLSSALFLISGEHYFPSQKGRITAPPYRQGLREAFIAETRDAAKYEEAAHSVNDRCLRETLEDIAEEEMRNAKELRQMLQDTLR